MASCAVDAAQSILSNIAETCPRVPNTLYLVSGTFNTIFLYILAFNTRARTLSISSRYDAFGPHQYLASNSKFDRIYATTWALPPSLSSWIVHWGTDGPTLEFLNKADITATSSYITVHSDNIYSTGGPTGEIHRIDPHHGGFGEKLQQLLYVEPHELETTDKTRKALRYGSHALEINVDGKAFVPHLGHNSIWVYKLDHQSERLEFVNEVKSLRPDDGPRHVIPSANGKYLYSVTEHTSFVDVYEIVGFDLVHRQSVSLIPSDLSSGAFRGDTLRLSRRQGSPFLFATTRGSTPAQRGYLSAIALNSDGLVRDASTTYVEGTVNPTPSPIHLYETPTSGGKANAIEVAPHSVSGAGGAEDQEGIEWLVLTDDEEGYVLILEWSAARGTFEELSRVKLDSDSLASHAIWLS